jgi:6-oxo-cyclohex-1-ene-carbonyl-CoA hydrolase
VDGKFVPNPLVYTDGSVDEYGRLRHGESKTGDDLAAGKALLKQGKTDLSLLDKTVDAFCTKLMLTFPDCLTKTLETVRAHKLKNWDNSREHNRAWLSLNMMTEANAGFRAFNEGVGRNREINFVELRRRLAAGERWSEELIQAVHPKNQGK